jgi:uncharacterized membrane protein YkvA (DUF1232 family)
MKIGDIVLKIGNRAKDIGAKVLYPVFLLYHAYKRPETPFWAKNIIMASIAYFLAPFDSIPDLTPFLGYTDDISVMMFGLVSIACFINEDVRINARKSLDGVLVGYDQKVLEEIDQKL